MNLSQAKMKQIAYKYFKYLVLLSLIYMPVFGHLDALPIRIWDEARLAINAYEMLHDGDFIVTHFEGNPDMWNTKPPLLIWVQAIFMKLIGVNELAVRLPSAIAAFLTCLVILIFSARYLKKPWFGFIAVLVLITSHGYINVHATRTGDYDALLALFTTLSGLLFFIFCETRKNKYLYLFFACMAFAVLTKSITGLLFLPAFAIYAIWQKQLLALLKNKHFYFGLLAFLCLVIGYYLLREMNNPGYIAAIQENELGGRFLNTIENHKQGFWYYYNNFIDFQLSAWYLLVPCGLLTGLASKNQQINRITLFSSLMLITFLIIISTAQTKLEWYDVPMYPFLAILITVFIYHIFAWLRDSAWINHKLKYNIVPFLFLFLIAITPYSKIIDKTYKPQEYPWDKDFYEIGYYLKDAVKGRVDVDSSYLAYEGYNAHNSFYLKILQANGIRIAFKDWTNLDNNDKVIACQQNVKQYVENSYFYEIIQEKGNVVNYKIYGKKQ